MILYELSNDFKNIDEIEDNEEIKEIIINEIKNKTSNIIRLIRNKETKIDMIDLEIKRLQAMKKVEENKIKSIKEYTKECMQIIDVKKIETNLGNITLRKSPVSLRIMNDENIPNQFIEVIQETKIDKKAIIQHFKETGEMFEGIDYLTENKSLMIK